MKYGLSVTGTVHPDRIWPNNGGRPGDRLILTKRLGVGIVCTANRVGEASPETMEAAVGSMTALNKYAASTRTMALRSGAHCAPRIHEALGTREQGAVRFSFSWFNTQEEVDAAIRAVDELAR